MSARHTFIETRHRFVCTADLHLEEGRLVAIAAIVGALHATLLRIVPRARTAKDIFTLLALEFASRVYCVDNGVLVGTGSALETIGASVCEGYGEDVRAVGADCTVSNILYNRAGVLTEKHGGWFAKPS